VIIEWLANKKMDIDKTHYFWLPAMNKPLSAAELVDVRKAVLKKSYKIGRVRNVIKQMEGVTLLSLKKLSKEELVNGANNLTKRALYRDAIGVNINPFIPKKVAKKSTAASKHFEEKDAILSSDYAIKDARRVLSRMQNKTLKSLQGKTKMELIAMANNETLGVMYRDAGGEDIEHVFPQKIAKKSRSERTTGAREKKAKNAHDRTGNAMKSYSINKVRRVMSRMSGVTQKSLTGKTKSELLKQATPDMVAVMRREAAGESLANILPNKKIQKRNNEFEGFVNDNEDDAVYYGGSNNDNSDNDDDDMTGSEPKFKTSAERNAYFANLQKGKEYDAGKRIQTKMIERQVGEICGKKCAKYEDDPPGLRTCVSRCVPKYTKLLVDCDKVCWKEFDDPEKHKECVKKCRKNAKSNNNNNS